MLEGGGGYQKGSKDIFSPISVKLIFVLTEPEFIKLDKALFFGSPKIFGVSWGNFGQIRIVKYFFSISYTFSLKLF